MNTQVVKSAAVKMMAAGAMLAAAAPTLAARSARADSLKNYQVLKYLESSGTQAIDTGVKYADDTCLYTQMQVLNNNTGGHIGAIDQCSDNTNDRFHFYVENSTLYVFAAHSESSAVVNSVGDGSKIPNLGRDAPRRVRRGGGLSHAEAQRAQRWRIETSLPLSPAGCGRGIVAAWSSGRRFPSRFRPRGGNAASGTRRPRRAAPTQGQGRGSPRRASWPTSPERACGSRPRGARGRPCRTPATACRRSA